MITDKITIKYENTTFKMSKYIFNLYPLYIPKEVDKKKYNSDGIYRRKIKEKYTKKAIRTYFKEHHIKGQYRDYAEFFIVDKYHNYSQNIITDLERIIKDT